MQIRILESAKEDLREGWSFYERQAQGLGDYFLDCMQTDAKSLQIYGGIHEINDDFYRVCCKRFPFAIYYAITEQTIDIYAILDCRRDPDWNSLQLRIYRTKT